MATLDHSAHPLARLRGAPITRRLSAYREIGVVYSVLVVLAFVGYGVSGNFFSGFNLRSIISASAPLALVAIGQTFVMLTGGIDLSVGSTLSLVAVVGALYMADNSGRLLPGILMCLGIGLGVGLMNGLVVVFLRVEPIIATLGTMSIIQGLALLRSSVPGGSAPLELQNLTYQDIWFIPQAAVIVAGCFILGVAILRTTPYGMHIYAVGGDAEAARVSGIATWWVKLSAYLISGFCSGAAGLLLLGRLGIGDPLSGSTFMLLSVVAVAIGGTSLFGGRGGLIGTLGGVLILNVIGNVMNLAGLESYPQQLTNGLLIILVVAFYSLSRQRKNRMPSGGDLMTEK
jgi:ribose transport system permease protein